MKTKTRLSFTNKGFFQFLHSYLQQIQFHICSESAYADDRFSRLVFDTVYKNQGVLSTDFPFSILLQESKTDSYLQLWILHMK